LTKEEIIISPRMVERVETNGKIEHERSLSSNELYLQLDDSCEYIRDHFQDIKFNIETNSEEVKINSVIEEDICEEEASKHSHCVIYESDIDKDMDDMKNVEKVDLSCLKDLKAKSIAIDDISPYTHDSLNQSDINFRRDTTNTYHETSVATPRGAVADAYTKEMKLFLDKLKGLFRNNHFIVNWLGKTYRWIEDRFIKKEIIREAKTTVKACEGRINKPEVKRKCSDYHHSSSHLKRQTTILKTTGNNFSILLNMIMGIQLTVLSTNGVTLNGKNDISQYLRKSGHTLPSSTFYSSDVDGVSI
jgi:hypothetical protein